jgi:hypothetical protein
MSRGARRRIPRRRRNTCVVRTKKARVETHHKGLEERDRRRHDTSDLHYLSADDDAPYRMQKIGSWGQAAYVTDLSG